MPIRWKLILALGGPLITLLGALLVYDYARLRRDAYQDTEKQLVRLAEQYAIDFDREFRAIAQVARSTAALVEADPNITEPELYEILRRNVEGNQLIYGSCVAFEPGAFKRNPEHMTNPASVSKLEQAPGARPRPNPDLFCPYVYRGTKSLVRMEVADAYDYLDPKWEWYAIPRATGKAFWTEPFLDEGAGNVEMVTHVVPVVREGVFTGTVNVDIRLEKLRQMVMARRPPDTQIYLLSRNGTFIVAPFPGVIMKETIGEVARRYGNAELLELSERMGRGERGLVTVPDFTTREPFLVFFAPVESAGWASVATPAEPGEDQAVVTQPSGWSLAGAVSEHGIMSPVYAALRDRLLVGLGVIALVLGLVVAMASWITRPVGRLSSAVQQLSQGDLTAQAIGVKSRDEIGRLAGAFNSMVRQLRENVEALGRASAARNAAESELRVARAIQSSLLPREFPCRPEFELHACSAPAKFVGGDFFDFFFLSEHTLVMVIADVSGKSVPAAMFMAVARTLIRGLAKSRSLGHSPAAILNFANTELLRDNEEGLFVTVFLGIYDTRTGELRYANGGHPLPYLVPTSGAVRPVGETTGTLVGVLAESTFQERMMRLEPGQTLVFYTDGVPDARSSAGEFYRMSRFEGILAACRGHAPREVCGRVLDDVGDFQRSEAADDITLLVLHRSSEVHNAPGESGARGAGAPAHARGML
ncbi:MAG: SpoIIE family protein phosphatase [Phycisphaerales bacterium]|nr:SpoIIE family protein phosphatase [Phycisphaerales bacterium]